jgi:hypothetical protein
MAAELAVNNRIIQDEMFQEKNCLENKIKDNQLKNIIVLIIALVTLNHSNTVIARFVFLG